MKRLSTFCIAWLLIIGFTYGQEEKPTPCGPVPTENQLQWQDMEMYAFIHYSMNTYTDEEWGFGNENLELFNPSDLDCRQWARVCKHVRSNRARRMRPLRASYRKQLRRRSWPG